MKVWLSYNSKLLEMNCVKYLTLITISMYRDFVITVEYYCGHDVVNINLMEKPDWFLQKNQDGKVPVIEHSGKVGKTSSSQEIVSK